MSRRQVSVALLAGFLAASLGASEVVVLKGGQKIELKVPWTQQGNNAILTRADGTVFSVPLTEIDRAATAAAKKAVAAPRPDAAVAPPAQTPAEALRASRAVPKAKLRVTDSDVSHDSVAYLEVGSGSGEKKEGGKGPARLDVAGYDQAKAGSNLIVRGSLRNFGATTANNSRMSITVMDENGDVIASADASLAKGNLEPSETVAFTASIPVGDRIVGVLRFSPQWVAAPPPAPPAEAAAAARTASSAAGPTAGAAAPASQPPAPQPTPYGLGTLYAPAAAPAATTAPADSRQGYIPGASDPASQPKPPNL